MKTLVDMVNEFLGKDAATAEADTKSQQLRIGNSLEFWMTSADQPRRAVSPVEKARQKDRRRVARDSVTMKTPLDVYQGGPSFHDQARQRLTERRRQEEAEREQYRRQRYG